MWIQNVVIYSLERKREARCVIVEFKYDNKKETYDICKGIPVLVPKNLKDNIYSAMELVIEDINNKRFTVNSQLFEEKEFSACQQFA